VKIKGRSKRREGVGGGGREEGAQGDGEVRSEGERRSKR